MTRASCGGCLSALGLGLLALVGGWAGDPARAEVVVAGPSDYRERVRDLEPGDTLALESGTYRKGLQVHGLHGRPGKPIHIAGPEEGRPAVFLARSGHNTVSIVDSAYVTIRDLEIDGRGKAVDGVKAEGHARYAHHITLRNLRIHNLARNQQVVGISTKCPAWDWRIQGNVIEGAGTGVYLGDGNGAAPFIGGLIEHNLVTDPIGYALQVKHQPGRPDLGGMPKEPRTTTLRHNVFAKGDNSSTGGMARPNVLLGHFPPKGPGARDRYAVYGNLFYRNPTDEALFQGEGSIALYDNLFINPQGDALAIMPHKGQPRRIWIFHNTVIARGTGLFFRATDATRDQLVTGNAFFAERPLSGSFERNGENVSGPYAKASGRLAAPFAEPGRLDLTPASKESLRLEISLPPDLVWQLPDAGRDFAGRARTGQFAGAYAGPMDGAHWLPALEIKPVGGEPARNAPVREDGNG